MTRDDNERLEGEEAIIQTYLEPLAAGFAGALGLKDDCAVLSPAAGMDLVLKTDPIAEGVHFLADDAPADIGWKALAVNVSDLAAKGARPVAYLMALSFPTAPSRGWMAGFAAGLAEAQAAFGITLAGGDTDRRPGPVTISITVLGEVPHGGMIQRATARAGDALYVTGTLGEAALGLKFRLEPGLADRLSLSDDDRQSAIDRYRRPQPRLALREAVRAHARAAMDLSDGLAKDLGRMARASGCGARVALQDLPLGAAGAAAVAADGAHWRDVVASGDDYELLIAVAPDRMADFERAAAEARADGEGGVAVTRIGTMTSEGGVHLFKPDGSLFVPTRGGWDHF